MRLHLIEIADLPWLPSGLVETIRGLLLLCNSRPFRNYRSWAAGVIQETVSSKRCSHVVEVAAGRAPLTALLLEEERFSVPVTVSDLRPSPDFFAALESKYSGRIEAYKHPVDFRQRQAWPPGSLLLMSSAFHHVPERERCDCLQVLLQECKCLLIFEPLCRNIASFVLVFFALFPALLAPFLCRGSNGLMRRVFWCWLFPLAPVILVFDGLVSWLRIWSVKEWMRAGRTMQERGYTCDITILGGGWFCHGVLLQPLQA